MSYFEVLVIVKQAVTVSRIDQEKFFMVSQQTSSVLKCIYLENHEGAVY